MTINSERFIAIVDTLSFIASKKDLEKIRQFVEKAGDKLGLDSETIAQMRLAIDEAATNVLEHGYQNQPGWLEVIIKPAQTDLIVQLADQAASFDPLQIPPPDLSIPAPMRPPGGMGLHLIRQAVDDLSHKLLAGGGNQLTMHWHDVLPHK